MSDHNSSKFSTRSFGDCMKPVDLSSLDNNEFYTVYGLYRGLKVINSNDPAGINIKKEYISIFNNHYSYINKNIKSFPSMIVFCKVSTFKKDDIIYDETRDSDNFNFNYSKNYNDFYDPIFKKNNKFDGDDEAHTFSKSIDDGMNIYIYQYYYIYVSEDIITRYVNTKEVDIQYNKERYISIKSAKDSFTKSMLIYFHKYLIDKKNTEQLPYIDIAKFFYKKCQNDLSKADVTQQEFINKIKWYYNILESGYYPGLRSNFESNKEIELDCLQKTHTKEQIEFKSSVKPDFTSNVMMKYIINNYYSYQHSNNCIINLDDIELNNSSSDKDNGSVITNLTRKVSKNIVHSFGSSDFKFSIADIIGFTISINTMNGLVPHYKKNKNRVLMKHYIITAPKENVDYDNENDKVYHLNHSQNYYHNFNSDHTYFVKKILMYRYNYLVNYLYTLKNYNNDSWFKFDYKLKKTKLNYPIDSQQPYSMDIEFKLYFHKSLSKYLQFNNETNQINLINTDIDKNILCFIKLVFGNYKPSFNISTQIYNKDIITNYYLNNDNYHSFYKPPLNNSYYDTKNSYHDTDYSNLKFKDTNIKAFNIAEKSVDFSKKLTQYFTDNNLDELINIPLFDYQKRNVVWMSELERKVDNNQLYINASYLQHLNLKHIINDGVQYNNTKNLLMTTLNKYNITINGEKCYYLNNNYETKHYRNCKYYIGCDKDKSNLLIHNNINIIKKCDNTNTNNPYQLQLSGGLLCDDVGLGKTLSTISHLVNSKSLDKTKLENDNSSYMLNNLIILPPRLLKQWAFEIEKYVGTKYFNIKIIASITDIKKMYKKPKVSKKTTHKSKTNTSTQEGNNTTSSVFEKADIYLMSINLLNNMNYFKYIYESFQQELEKYEENELKYDITTYFDVFQIKWNRIIIDEVHESVTSIFDKNCKVSLPINKRKLVKNVIYNLQSNYRWGLSATPFQREVFNNYGYITWLSKTIKNNMMNVNTVKRLYANKLDKFNSENELIYYIADYINYYLTSSDTQKFQSICISKTRKMDVVSDLNIPIVTEEIIPIKLGNIEMNIYNSAKSVVNSTYNFGNRNKLKRLFQLCTNICISEEDVNNLEIDINKPVSLEQLNQAMVKTFTKKLVAETKKLQTLNYKIDNFKDHNEVCKLLRDFTNELVDFKSQTYQEIYGWVRDESKHHYSNNNQRNNWSKFYQYFKNKLFENIITCKDNASNLFLIISDIMCQDVVNEYNIKDYFNDSRILVLVNIIINNIVKNSSTSGSNIKKDIETCNREIIRLNNQIKLFQNNDFMKEKTQEPCPICWCDFEDDTKAIITKCRHVLCIECFENLLGNKSCVPCPECREPIIKKSVITIKVGDINETPEENKKRLEKEEALKAKEYENIPDWEIKCISKYGTKMSVLIKYLKKIFSETDNEGNNVGHRAIVFSQYENMLNLIGKTLNEFEIKNVYAKGNVHVLNKNIDSFKRDKSIRVIMLSSENSNSGSNLTEASHIIMVDVLNMDKLETREVETQAIGRAVRLGQKKPVKIVRLVTQNTIESEYYTKNKYPLTNN